MMHLRVGLRYNFIYFELDFLLFGIECVWMPKLILFLVQPSAHIDCCSPEVSVSTLACLEHTDRNDCSFSQFPLDPKLFHQTKIFVIIMTPALVPLRIKLHIAIWSANMVVFSSLVDLRRMRTEVKNV